MQRNCTVGDRVSVVSGPYEGRSGIVTHVRTPEEVLFEGMANPLSGSLLEEPYAVLKTRLVAEVDGSVRDDEIAVPVRRLRPR